MNHPVTESMKILVCELHALGELIELRVGAASREARYEWRLLRAQLPAIEALACGTLALSDADLRRTKTKLERFAEILRELGAKARPVVVPSPPLTRRQARRPS